MKKFLLWFWLCVGTAIGGLLTGESHWTVIEHDFLMGVAVMACAFMDRDKPARPDTKTLAGTDRLR